MAACMDGAHAQAIGARFVAGGLGGRSPGANPIVRQLAGRDAGGKVEATGRLIISVDHRRRARDHLHGAIYDQAQRGLRACPVTRACLVDRRADTIELLERFEKLGDGLVRRDGRNGSRVLHAYSITDHLQRAVAVIPGTLPGIPPSKKPGQIIRGRASLQKPGLSRARCHRRGVRSPEGHPDPGCAQDRWSNVVVHHILVGMRAQPDWVNVVLHLPVDPGLDQVLGEDAAPQQELVVGFEVRSGLLPANPAPVARSNRPAS